jgi:hypothetical protein
LTGSKTDNREFASKNPEQWGAEKNENDNNGIERSVKDDNPAKAGFFLVFRFECRKACQSDCKPSPDAGWSAE